MTAQTSDDGDGENKSISLPKRRLWSSYTSSDGKVRFMGVIDSSLNFVFCEALVFSLTTVMKHARISAPLPLRYSGMRSL